MTKLLLSDMLGINPDEDECNEGYETGSKAAEGGEA